MSLLQNRASQVQLPELEISKPPYGSRSMASNTPKNKLQVMIEQPELGQDLTQLVVE
jgi:hypothetical protein